MPRVAIYIRVSTDEQAASAETQERGAIAWCQRQGHTIVATYRDIGHSGAEWVTRPEVLCLEADAKRAPRPFEAVVVRDVDRLGREAVRLPMLLAVLREHGVGVLEYATGRSVELDGVGLIVSNVLAAVAQVERENIARRVRGAHATQLAAGRVVGGSVYGYRNVRGADGVRHVIDAAQAEVVREIFERHARGESPRVIAHDLNARGVAAPVAGKRGTGSWSPSTIYEMVRRDRYRGVIRWGDRGSTYRGGTKVHTTGGECIEVRDPSLAIVSEALWTRAQRTRDTQAAATDRTPRRGREPRYLLVGLAVCGECGGPIGSMRTKASGVTVPAYGCTWHRDRGVCRASWMRPTADADRVVLSWLVDEVLDPTRLRAAIAEGRRRALAAPSPSAAVDVEKLRAEERTLATAVSRLTLALETAGDVPEVAARLRERSARLREVRDELARAAAPAAPVVPIDIEALVDDVVASLKEVLATDLAGARKVLDGVLPKRLRMSWEMVSEGKGRARKSEVWVEGEADAGGALFAAVSARSTLGIEASPEGFVNTPRFAMTRLRRAI
jgi:DNA invertase Pin-like site-specific DNA recombinase